MTDRDTLYRRQLEVLHALEQHPFWKSGRGAGKSYLRMVLIKWLFEEEAKEAGRIE